MGKKQTGKKKQPHIPTTQLTPDQLNEINKTFNLATQLHQQGNLVQAETLYKEILNLQPNHADAYHLLGVMAQQIGEWDASIDLIKQAISINNKPAPYHYNLGLSLQQAEHLDEAVNAYQKAIRLQPNYREAYENLSAALRDLNKTDSAIEACKHALDLNPNALIANQNMGALLNTTGQRQAAIEYIDKVLNISPAYPEAHWVKALALLSMGDYQNGWEEYEWRFFTKAFNKEHLPRTVPFPKWEGENLSGKSILINPEQGVGDEILFSTCFNEIIQQAKQCYIECDPRLTRLFSRSFPEAIILPADRARDFVWDKTLPRFDFRISAGSLPRFLRQNSTDFPSNPAHLSADHALIEHWRERLANLPNQINIGISWCGGKDNKQKYTRSIPLQQWKKILKQEGINYINLQYGDHEKEVNAINQIKGIKLHHFEDLDPIKDLENFSALISTLDLVISIDNSTVHFSGALGIPTWVILPMGSAWAWQQEREDCDWYQSVKLFRQKRKDHGVWGKVLENVYNALPKDPSRPPPLAERFSQQQDNIFSPNTDNGLKSVALLNDTTSWYHWGCSCTSLAIHQTLRNRYDRVFPIPIYKTNNFHLLPDSIEKFDDEQFFKTFSHHHGNIIETIRSADAIYINGEGTLHGLSAQALGLLYLAYSAKTFLDKPVYLVNHSCYPEDNTIVKNSAAYQLYSKVYKQLDYIAIREVISHSLVEEMGINTQLSFDCLPLFIQNNYRQCSPKIEKQIVISGSVSWQSKNIEEVARYAQKMANEGYAITLLIGANAFLANDDMQFCEMFTQIYGNDYQLKLATSEQDWLEIIARAQLLVSGRFHHSIAAAFLGTPFIVLNSNTPKIKGLEQMLAINCHLDSDQPDLGHQLQQRTNALIDNPQPYQIDKEQRNVLYNLISTNFAP